MPFLFFRPALFIIYDVHFRLGLPKMDFQKGVFRSPRVGPTHMQCAWTWALVRYRITVEYEKMSRVVRASTGVKRHGESR